MRCEYHRQPSKFYMHPMTYSRVSICDNILQSPLLALLLITLNSITNPEVLPSLKRDTAFGILAHLLNILLLALQRVQNT